MPNIKKLKRVFVVGATRVDDPAPNLTLKESTQILAPQYPQFRWTEVLESDGRVVGDSIEYKLVLPPAKTNG